MSAKDELRIEIVLAMPERQFLQGLSVPQGTSIADAVKMSRVAEVFPELDIAALSFGIWGNVVGRTCNVRDGDRIEVYRPLPVNPRDARRQIAVEGGFMGTSVRKSAKD
jgi:putative ubiquitin-RnfH superfamily antitoxin RatB of RatAB toxin-antitoxin module